MGHRSPGDGGDRDGQSAFLEGANLRAGHGNIAVQASPDGLSDTPRKSRPTP